MFDVSINNIVLSKNKQPYINRPRLSMPQEGISLAAATEACAVHVRKAVTLLAGGFDETRLSEIFTTMFAPRWELDLGIQDDSNNLSVRAAWNLVCMWLLARGSGAIDRSAGFGEGEDWFLGGSTVQMPRLSLIIVPDSMAQAHEELSQVQIDEDFWDLFPYVLEEHGPGSRASILRDPSTRAARNAKKVNGVFYTPADVADYMARQMLTNYKGDVLIAKCLDPACGAATASTWGKSLYIAVSSIRYGLSSKNVTAYCIQAESFAWSPPMSISIRSTGC